MEQLLTNLVSNAMKYNVKNGKVTVKAVPDAHYLNISVIDTGIGIDEESLPCIFDEFYQGSGTQHTVYDRHRIRIVDREKDRGITLRRITGPSKVEKEQSLPLSYP